MTTIYLQTSSESVALPTLLIQHSQITCFNLKQSNLTGLELSVNGRPKFLSITALKNTNEHH
jgi:hypothetical protein